MKVISNPSPDAVLSEENVESINDPDEVEVFSAENFHSYINQDK